MRVTTNIQDLVLIGGGHSHLSVIKSLSMQPIAGLRITVISRDIHTPYSGMMPGLIAGHYRFDEAHIDLRPLCERAGARLFHSSVTSLDLQQQLIQCDNRPPVRFDWLSINSGSTPSLASIDGARDVGIAVKPIDQFLQAIGDLKQQIEAGTGPHTIAVVGGGAASVEVILALQYSLGQLPVMPRFSLLCASEELLPTYHQRVRRHFNQLLRDRNIELRTGAEVIAAEVGQLTLGNGKKVAADAIIWALSAASPDWPAAAGLDCDEQGFIRVNEFLQSSSSPQVFAAGDVAHFDPRPLAKSGVYAVRAGAILSKNLHNAINNKPLVRFKPQRQFLSLLSEGEKVATASRGRFTISGQWVWRWKHRIDSSFIKRFSQPTAMTAQKALDLPMRCGGCGAKVGNTILQRVMAELQPITHKSIIIGINSPDDAAVIQPPPGMALVQTVDYFRSFIDDPYLIGRIATNHCLSDIYAMGATPHSALAIATLPYQSEVLLEDSLRQLMQGALESLNLQQTSLIGGHTSEGAEMGFGLAVNGFIEPAKILGKNRALTGQKIILTKALGSGTLLAANMQHCAQGRWIDYAIGQMLIDNRKAAQVLTEYGATACTDITGFGLLGHLQEVMVASKLGAQLQLNTLPLLPGAKECLQKNILSTLHPQNVAASSALLNASEYKSQPIFNILFDPQTAGGLLATVPADSADDCLRALQDKGLKQACIIGTVEDSIAEGHILLS